MRKSLLIFLCAINLFAAKAQSDTSAPSPLSISFGAGVGAGFVIGQPEELFAHYELLQNEFSTYLDSRNQVTVLFREKFGFRILAGQLGRRGSGAGISNHLNSYYPGYKYLFDYSYLRSGYVYRYISPQFVYRKGAEQFNFTLCAGGGLGVTDHAYGTAILQDIGTNDFMQVDYGSSRTREVNIAVDAELAYVRQLSQHWFMNAGASLSYTGLFQYYDFNYRELNYQQTYWVEYYNHVDGLMHHIAAGLFVNFQWNTKESERVIYE